MEYYAVNGFFTMCVAYEVWHLRLHYLLCVCMEIIAMCYVLYVIFRLHAKGMVRIRVIVRNSAWVMVRMVDGRYIHNYLV